MRNKGCYTWSIIIAVFTKFAGILEEMCVK